MFKNTNETLPTHSTTFVLDTLRVKRWTRYSEAAYPSPTSWLPDPANSRGKLAWPGEHCAD